jgi:hypothetical protein
MAIVCYANCVYNGSMKVSTRFSVVLLMAILMSGLGWQRSSAQIAPGREYFPETGHYVRGEFLVKYHSVPNPKELYGNPISIAFVSPTIGRLVQYFEKARFELDGEKLSGQQVQVSDLGKLVRGDKQPVTGVENSPACKTFPETGFQVCFAFLEFCNANGGEAQFGHPISNREVWTDGQQVQYFQKARLELRPGLPPGKRIIVAELGRIAFYTLGEDPTMLIAEQDDSTINSIVELKVHAYSKSAVVPRSGNQTIYVVVQDQRLLPVFGARVELVITMPSGEPRRILIPGTTGENGIIQYTFPYSTQSLGIVKVEVQVKLEDKLLGRTVTSFRIWW